MSLWLLALDSQGEAARVGLSLPTGAGVGAGVDSLGEAAVAGSRRLMRTRLTLARSSSSHAKGRPRKMSRLC